MTKIRLPMSCYIGLGCLLFHLRRLYPCHSSLLHFPTLARSLISSFKWKLNWLIYELDFSTASIKTLTLHKQLQLSNLICLSDPALSLHINHGSLLTCLLPYFVIKLHHFQSQTKSFPFPNLSVGSSFHFQGPYFVRRVWVWNSIIF